MRPWILLASPLLVLATAGWHSATQTSVADGVTVAVTAGNLGPETGLWDFAVAMEAPGHRLDDDMLAGAVLFGDGEPVRPVRWEGARPGGSHRAGVLIFVAPTKRPRELELRIQRSGEPQPRVFRFALGRWAA